jgi:hypothetical protein
LPTSDVSDLRPASRNHRQTYSTAAARHYLFAFLCLQNAGAAAAAVSSLAECRRYERVRTGNTLPCALQRHSETTKACCCSPGRAMPKPFALHAHLPDRCASEPSRDGSRRRGGGAPIDLLRFSRTNAPPTRARRRALRGPDYCCMLRLGSCDAARRRLAVCLTHHTGFSFSFPC